VKDGHFDFKLWGEVGMKNLTPLWLLKYLPNMLSCHVTIIHAAKGPSNTITCGEASGLLSVAEAARTIQRDSADISIAGGAESKLNPMGLLRQMQMKRLSTLNDDPANACRPFDVDRNGTVIGEGGGLLILEELSRAQGRKARIYAEVVGFGAGCDPEGIFFMEKPGTGGLAGAIAMALSEAGITPADVDLVIPQGNGVRNEDVAEAQALHEALGERAKQVPVLPLNGGMGSLFAGSGAVNLAVAAMALHKQTIPPATNCVKVDPACGLNVPTAAIQKPLRYALTAGYAIGGQAAAMVLKRYE
jgi:3-oxoacyl-[acyl-carrier-protein] synthase II